MSNASQGTRQRVALALQASVGRTLRAAGFWAAVTLPFAILALLASGTAQRYPSALVGLLAVNLLALVLGRDHNR
jgi:hypothetical protein